jgi:hypothetical protein
LKPVHRDFLSGNTHEFDGSIHRNLFFTGRTSTTAGCIDPGFLEIIG